MAIIQAGLTRATEDIDLLIDTSPENQEHVRRALLELPDQAIRDMTDDDLDKYVVVRVADEQTLRDKDRADRDFLTALLRRSR